MLYVLDERVARLADLDAGQDLGNLVFGNAIASLLHLLNFGLNFFILFNTVLQLDLHEMGLLAHGLVFAVDAINCGFCFLEQCFEHKLVRLELCDLLVAHRDGLAHQRYVKIVLV
jgi:hypothetical protein